MANKYGYEPVTKETHPKYGYESVTAEKATDEDIGQAKQKLLKKYPEWLVKALLPAATKMAENKNAPRGIGSKILNPKEGDFPGAGSLGANVRALRNAPLSAAENIVDFIPSLLGKSVVDRNAEFPEGFKPEPEDIKHPAASFMGGLSGVAALGGPLTMGARAVIPAINTFAKSGFLPSLGASTTEGGVLGALMSNPGERGSGALVGAALGAGGNILHDLIKTLPGGVEWLKKYANTAKYEKKLNKTQQELKKAEQEYAPEVEQDKLAQLKAQEEHQKIVDYLESHVPYRTAKPTALKGKADERKVLKQELMNKLDEIPEEYKTNEKPSEPDVQDLDLLEHPEANFIDEKNIPKMEVDETPVQEAESLLKTNEQKHAEHEEKFATEHLHKGKAVKKRVAQKLNQKIDEIYEDIGTEYDQYGDDYKKQHIVIERNKDNSNLLGHIVDDLEQNKAKSKEVANLNKEMNSSGNKVYIPANHFISAYRSLRQMAQKTRASAYGEMPIEHDRLIARADEMDADVKKMEQLIESNLPDDAVKRLHKINKRYATEFAPLYEEPFYKQILKGKAPTNMMEALSGEPHVRANSKKQITGKRIIKNLVNQDPEIMSYILGERYAKNPKAIHEFDEIAKEYLDIMPEEFKSAMSEHKQNLENLEQSKTNLQQKKEEAQILKEHAEKRHAEEKEFAKNYNKEEKERIQKLIEQQKKEAIQKNKSEQKRYKMQKLHYETKKQIEKLDKEIELLEQAAKESQEKADAVIKNKKPGIGLQKIMELKKQARQDNLELLRAKKERGRLLKKAATFAGIGASALIGKRYF